MPKKDKLSEALRNGLPQKSKVPTVEHTEPDPVNDVEPSELDDVTAKMTGNDTLGGIMPHDKAKELIDSLPLEVVVSAKAWDGKVGIKIDSHGNLALVRSEAAPFDSSNPDRLVRNLLYKAFTEGRGIKKWDVYIPEVNDNMDRADKVLSNKRLRSALQGLAEAGKIEVLLNARYGRGFASPNIIIGNKGTGTRKTTHELTADELMF